MWDELPHFQSVQVTSEQWAAYVLHAWCEGMGGLDWIWGRFKTGWALDLEKTSSAPPCLCVRALIRSQGKESSCFLLGGAPAYEHDLLRAHILEYLLSWEYYDFTFPYCNDKSVFGLKGLLHGIFFRLMIPLIFLPLMCSDCKNHTKEFQRNIVAFP